MRTMGWVVASILSLLLPASAGALGPMYSFRDLVAGEGTSGKKDGPFFRALFHSPLGVALDPGGRRLFIGDQDNHAIRMVDLAHDNFVSTLSGGKGKGFRDGPLASAAFNRPGGLVMLPDGNLVVADQDNGRLRLVDLRQGRVSTLAGDGTEGSKDGKAGNSQADRIWGLAYLEQEKALYFSQPTYGTLRKLDLASMETSTVLKGDVQLPRPGALCIGAGQLYVSDRSNGKVFRVLPAPSQEGVAPSVRLELVSEGRKALALAWSEDALYSLEADPNSPVARLSPPGQVPFLTTVGDVLQEPTRMGLFQDVLKGQPMALVPDPSSRKFFISHPSLNIITSFRDLRQEQNSKTHDLNSQGLMDFEYPLLKPPGVFRVLVVGDSHLYHNYHLDKFVDNRMSVLAKRMELELNMTAALEGASGRFEVMSLAAPSSEPLNLWPYYKVPAAVEKYDIDLVLHTQLNTNRHPRIYVPYFERPITSEGIPAYDMDPEHLLKPWEERAKEGLALELVEACRKKGLLEARPGEALPFGDFQKMVEDPDIREILLRMYSRPIQLLKAKLGSRRTKQGGRIGYGICLIALPQYDRSSRDRVFWREAQKGTGLPLLDLTDLMTVFRVSLFPLSCMDGEDHFNDQGHQFLGTAIARELIKKQWVPFPVGGR